MDNSLLLFSGNDIPFIEARLLVHNPTIKEISFIGEDNFFAGRELINFSKNSSLNKLSIGDILKEFQNNSIKKYSKKIFTILGLKDLSRVDFLYDMDTKSLYFIFHLCGKFFIYSHDPPPLLLLW